MADPCAGQGHLWRSLGIPGWFRCERVVRTKLVYRNKSQVGMKTKQCGVIGVCPGCLGSLPSGYSLSYCLVHASDNPQEVFPVTDH